MGVTLAPLFIQFPEGEVNSADITADAFYDRLEAMRPQIPTTAMPSTGLFAEIYRKVAQAEKNILSIHISSGLSGTINAAREGGEAGQTRSGRHLLGHAHPLWRRTLPGDGSRAGEQGGLGLRRDQGDGWRKSARRPRSSTRSTRWNTWRAAAASARVKALAGALLNLKPVIRVDTDGKYSTVSTGRTLAKSMTAIAEHLHEKYAGTPVWVTVLHGRFADKADVLTGELNSKLNMENLEVMRISPVLGVHTGPGIVGAAVVPDGINGRPGKVTDVRQSKNS